MPWFGIAMTARNTRYARLEGSSRPMAGKAAGRGGEGPVPEERLHVLEAGAGGAARVSEHVPLGDTIAVGNAA